MEAIRNREFPSPAAAPVGARVVPPAATDVPDWGTNRPARTRVDEPLSSPSAAASPRWQPPFGTDDARGRQPAAGVSAFGSWATPKPLGSAARRPRFLPAGRRAPSPYRTRARRPFAGGACARRRNGVTDLSSFVITGEQIRAARALARLEQAQLAKAAGVSLETVKRLEGIRGPVAAQTRTLAALARAFAGAGVRLEADGGVRTATPGPALRGDTAGLAGADPLHRIIYWSRAVAARPGSMRPALEEVERISQALNAAEGITGALAARGGVFLGLLEGPRTAVRRRFGAIGVDPRHTDIVVVESRQVQTRHFADWTLCCGAFPSDLEIFAAEPAMREGLQPERLTPASALGLLSLLRELQAEPPRTGRTSIRNCPLDRDCEDRICAAT